jgi:hypothetical protein
VQQEMDINYGPFKGVIQRNLAKIAMTCYVKGIAMSRGTFTFGLILYSGVCPDSRITLENALKSAFNKMVNTHSWSEVGVLPFTKKCLTNKKVCHHGMDKEYPNLNIFQDIQSQNNFSTTQLNIMGYKGDVLKSQFRENRYPRLASTKRLLPLQIRMGRSILSWQASISSPKTCSKRQKSIGGRQRPRRWRMARRAGWNIISDKRPHCPSLSTW